MKKENKTEEQLIKEIEGLRLRLVEMEKSKSKHEEMERLISKFSSLKVELIATRKIDENLKLITDGLVDIFGADFARI